MAGHNEAPQGIGRFRILVGNPETNLLDVNANLSLNGWNINTGTNPGCSFGSAGTDRISFYGATPVVQQTGVAVSAAAIHAALVNLGLITA